MKIADAIGAVLVLIAVGLLVACGWGATFGHVATYRIAWWATAAGILGLAALVVSPRTTR